MSDTGAVRGPKKVASYWQALLVGAVGRDWKNQYVRGCLLGSCGGASRGPLKGSVEGSRGPCRASFGFLFLCIGDMLERRGSPWGVLDWSWEFLGASWAPRGGRLDLSVCSHRLKLLRSLSREPPAPSSSWGEGYICRFVVSVWSSSGACLGSLLGRLGRSVAVSGLSWAALGDF